jgi:AcrR family transcriptional regulator
MPKIVDHDSYRQELLQKAFALFAESGYGNLSMKELAAGLSVSPGVLYHYFAGKQDMFLQMLQQFSLSLLGQLAQRVSAAATFEEKVVAVFAHMGEREQEYLNLYLATTDFMRLIGVKEFQQNPAINDVLRRYFEDLQNSLGITREQALLLVTYSMGVLVSGFLLPSRTPLPEHQGLLLDLIQGKGLSFQNTNSN